MIEFCHSTNEYLDKKSIVDYVGFVVSNRSEDIDNVVEVMNYNFTQFFEYCKAMGVIRTFKKDYMD